MPRRISIRDTDETGALGWVQCRVRSSDCALTHLLTHHSQACSFAHLIPHALQNEHEERPHKSQFSSPLKHWAFGVQTSLTHAANLKHKTSFRAFTTSQDYPISHSLWVNRVDSLKITRLIIISCQDKIKNWVGTDRLTALSIFKMNHSDVLVIIL